MKYSIKNFSRKRIPIFLQILVLLAIGLTLWKGIHRPPTISSDVYTYITSIPPELVLQSRLEGERISSKGWADILALKTSLSEDQLKSILRQLQSGTRFEKITWESESGKLPEDKIKLVKRRREILLTYPYFEPHRFKFPVLAETWYQDTFGADREGGVRRHEGADLFSPEGTLLGSVCSGQIEKLGWNRLGGERIGVRGEDGNYYYYAHLQSIEPGLKIGQKIQKGDRIGKLGHTGDALTTPDHLHFGIELPNGVWINPYPFLYVWQHQE